MILFSEIRVNALKRNSTFGLDFRELSVGVRQWRECLELASERLSQIFHIFIKWERVDTDGVPAVTKGRI